MCTAPVAGTITTTDDGGAPAAEAGLVLLHLMWLASPALPVGAFSYSEGLEAAVDAGLVTSEDAAARWLGDQLALALARAELPLMLRAFDAWQQADVDRVAGLNDWVCRSRESAESRRQTEQTGRSMADWLRNGGTRSGSGSGSGEIDPRVRALAGLAPAPTWPIAFALAAVQTGAAPRDAALAFAFGWAENMVQAAMKAVPLGQAAAQRLLGRLAALTPAAVDAARALAGVEPGAPSAAAAPACPEPQAYAPMWAILSAQHESQYSRLFRS